MAQKEQKKGSFIDRLFHKKDKTETPVQLSVAPAPEKVNNAPDWVIEIIMKWMLDPTQKGCLDLSSKELDTIPIELCGIRNVTELILAKNKIESLPSHIKQLGNNEHITKIDLSDNLLSEVAEELQSVATLKSLKLSSNKFTTFPKAIFTLTNLRKLDLSRNSIVALPDTFESLVNLSSLNLSRNRYLLDYSSIPTASEVGLAKGCLPASITKLPKLKHLHLSKIRLRVTPENLGSLKKLKTLDLSGNKLTTLLPPSSASWDQQKNETAFETPHSTDKIIQAMFGDSPLPYFCPWILELQDLKELNLSSNRLEVLPLEIGLLGSSLKKLQLENNPFSKMPPQFKAKLAKSTNSVILFLRRSLRAIPSLRVHLFFEKECSWNTVKATLKKEGIEAVAETYTTKDDENEVELNIDKINIEKMIQILTHPSKQIASLFRLFMMTYDYFITLPELVELLILRYMAKNKSDTSADAAAMKNFEIPRLRTFNLLKKVIEAEESNVKQNQGLMGLITKFATAANDSNVNALVTALTTESIRNVIAPSISSSISASSVQQSVNQSVGRKASDSQLDRRLKRSSLKLTVSAEKQYTAHKHSRFSVRLPAIPALQISGRYEVLFLLPSELAQQLTMHDWEIFSSLPEKEFLHQRWTRKQAPSIAKFIARFNFVSNWVATEVVKVKDLKKRAKTISHFLEVAGECLGYNNFSSAFSIYSALCNASVIRLKETWGLIPEKFIAINNQLSLLLNNSNNYNNYRKAMQQVRGACVPYLGLFLQDLTFVEDGNMTRMKKTEMINLTKFQLIRMVIERLKIFQTRHAYTFTVSEDLQTFFTTVEIYDEDKMYQESLVCEERKGSRVAQIPAKVEVPNANDFNELVVRSPRTRSYSNIRHVQEVAGAHMKALGIDSQSRLRSESTDMIMSPRSVVPSNQRVPAITVSATVSKENVPSVVKATSSNSIPSAIPDYDQSPLKQSSSKPFIVVDSLSSTNLVPSTSG